jgi:hypothetical protein
VSWHNLTRLGGFVAVAFGALAGFTFLLGLSSPNRPEATAELGALADPDEVYDPVAAGEDLPEGYRNTLRRDDILPVYDPEFVPAREIDWSDDSLVIGVQIDSEAKAYPVDHLNRREMVVDRLAGVPILVTW